jgi:ankyrin repeat protein
MAKMLLAADGIDICAKDIYATTVLMHACVGGYIQIAKELLAAIKKTPNFDINDKNINGTTGLMLACEHSHVEVVKLLLTIPRINTHLKSNLGKKTLDYAKGRTNEDEIKALFQGELLHLQL